MSQKQLTKAQLVDRFGESAKQIERYVAEGMPCSGTGRARRFPWPEVRTWRDARLKRLEREATERRLTPATDAEVKAARDARTVAEAKLLQIDLAERERKLITLAHHEQVVGEIGDRLLAVLMNVPSNYLLHLERAGVPPEKAQSVLEEIALALTLALRATADDLEADDDGALAA